jgi:hypothetical protein
LLTLSGTIDFPDGGSGDPSTAIQSRVLNLSGDGDIRIEGQITDVTGPSDGGNVGLTKTGSGTVTIATTPTGTAGEGYHQARTVIDGGTLAVEAIGGTDGELFSRTIEVTNGATFDVSSFTAYNLQVLDSGLGQILSGAGTINLGGPGSTLGLFSDSTVAPGDTPDHVMGGINQDITNGFNATGTLTINGDVSDGGASFEMEVAGNGDNDRVTISGAATLAANIKVIGVPPTLTNGATFTLISAAGGITDSGITFDLPSANYVSSVTATEVRLIWTDNDPPLAVALNPNNGVTNVYPKSSLRLSFNEPVSKGTGNITIRRSSDNAVLATIDVTSANVTVDGAKVTIVPTVQLPALTGCYVNVPSGAIVDGNSNPYAGIADTTTWTFTTGSVNLREPVLVNHRFTDGGDALDTTPADYFDAGITAAGGSNIWGAGVAFLDNGTVLLDAIQNGAYLNLGSYVNGAQGTVNGKFNLTMTISPTTGNWISLGFATQNTPSKQRNFTNTGTGDATTGIGTIVYRANGELDMWGGPLTANAVDGPDANTGDRTLTVTLDFTPAGGYDGVGNFGTVIWSDSLLGPLGSYTYTSPQSFGSILITEATSSAGTINGLTLTQVLVPTLLIAPSGQNLTFQWDNLAGKQYDLLATNNVAAPVATWPPYNDGVITYTNIPASGSGVNVVGNVVKVGPANYFILIEKP